MSPSAEIRLFVIIPVYGNWSDTLDCLRDLAAQTNPGFQVLISDDGSPSAPPPEIREFEFAHYLRFPHRGFAANSNAGAAEAIRRSATHLLFLNSDTSFSSDFIEAWLRTARARPDAILSPVVYWFRKPSRIWYSGGKFSIWTPFFRYRRNYREVTQVDIVCGCALLVPAAAWTKLQGFAECYVMYYEDFDLVMRAKRQGIQTCVVPDRDLHVLHKVAGSFGGNTEWRQKYHLLTSSLVFIRSHYRGFRKQACLGLTLVQIGVMLLRGLPRLPNPALLWRAVARGLYDEQAGTLG